MIAQHTTESSQRAAKANIRGPQGPGAGNERTGTRRAVAVATSLHDDGAEPAVSALERVAVLGYN